MAGDRRLFPFAAGLGEHLAEFCDGGGVRAAVPLMQHVGLGLGERSARRQAKGRKAQDRRDGSKLKHWSSSWCSLIPRASSNAAGPCCRRHFLAPLHFHIMIAGRSSVNIKPKRRPRRRGESNRATKEKMEGTFLRTRRAERNAKAVDMRTGERPLHRPPGGPSRRNQAQGAALHLFYDEHIGRSTPVAPSRA